MDPNNKYNNIHWGQAVKRNDYQSIVEEVILKVQKAVHYFTKNTAAQFAHMDLYGGLMELGFALYKKDYSEFLFEKCDEKLKQFESILPEAEKAREVFTKAAETVSELNKYCTCEDEPSWAVGGKCVTCGKIVLKKSTRPDDFNVQELIEDLVGTCKTIGDFLPEGMDENDLTEEDHEAIDERIFNCDTCGWWCERDEEDPNNEGNCNDHSDEEQ